jgi:hypothetical protein
VQALDIAWRFSRRFVHTPTTPKDEKRRLMMTVTQPDATTKGFTRWFGSLEAVKTLSPFMTTQATAVVAAIGTLAAAIIGLITSLGAVDWSAAQISLVTAEVAATIAFLTAIITHFWPDTKKQPVAVAATLTAFLTATLTLGTGFAWWSFTAAQASALVAVVSSIIGVGSGLIARNLVTADKTPPSA